MNVTGLVDSDTGNVVERYEYTPYGEVTVLDADFTADADNASDLDNRILYCGYRHDPATGLYHVRHRYYHCTLGRWTSRDPLGYVDGMSVYEYVASCPSENRDSYGLMSDFQAFAEMFAHWSAPNDRDEFRRVDNSAWAGFLMTFENAGVATWRNKAEMVLKDEAQAAWNDNALSSGHFRTARMIMQVNGRLTVFVLNGVGYRMSGDYTVDRRSCTVTFNRVWHAVDDRADVDGFKDFAIAGAELAGRIIDLIPAYRIGGWLLGYGAPYQPFRVYIKWTTEQVVFECTERGHCFIKNGDWPAHES